MTFRNGGRHAFFANLPLPGGSAPAWVWVLAAGVAGLAGLAVTAAWRWRSRRYLDRVTGLYQEPWFTERLRWMLPEEQVPCLDGAAEGPRPPLAVVVADVDGFRSLNESLGQRAGDEVLAEMSRRLKEAVGESGMYVARLAADTFAWLWTDGTGEEAVRRTAAVLDKLSAPVAVGGRAHRVTLSAGVAVYPADGSDAGTLLRHAATALDSAKSEGRGVVRAYHPSMGRRFQERFRLESELQRALSEGEFVLYYQPRVHLASGRVTGVEALLRWRHPTLGLLPPGRFIPMAEETGLIVPIGHWVIDAACRQLKEWREGGISGVRVAVNISPKQFRHEDVVRTIGRALAEHCVDPGQLEVEITEQVVM
ncbi:MAG: EAL domain-containing protein, partial [Alicyclobacillus sp.]|nr:EAL domain-containing protein [Alicyclobacillus sp.]